MTKSELERLKSSIGRIVHGDSHAVHGWDTPLVNKLVAVFEESYNQEIEQAKVVAQNREAELLDSLYWMYIQYCSGGHLFMGAGEQASDLLEDAGYITVDNIGAVVKDNGASREQSLKLPDAAPPTQQEKE